MPRKPRAEELNTIYHILNRANARMKICFTCEDYEMIENTLFEAKIKFDINIYTYCIMSNHFHLLLSGNKEGEIQKFMHWFTSIQTQRWHKIHNTSGTGHLYQGRYKMFKVDNEKYFFTVLRYIEQNPIKAKITQTIGEWKYSASHLLLNSNIEIQKTITFLDGMNKDYYIRLCSLSVSENEILMISDYFDNQEFL